MRSLSILVLGAAVAFAPVAAQAKPKKQAPAAGAPAASGTGALIIHSPTAGAEVFVDNERVGQTPVDLPLPVTPGEHTIKVTKPGFAPFIDVFTAQKKKDTTLEIELVPVSGIAKINANVEKARVFVDGKFVCEAPCSADIGVGARAVQVSKGGYKDFFQNVNAVAGQEVALEVQLEELPMGLNPYKPAPPPPPKWYEKWWVWTAVGGGVAVAIVAIVVPVTVAQRDPIKDFSPGYSFTITVPMK